LFQREIKPIFGEKVPFGIFTVEKRKYMPYVESIFFDKYLQPGVLHHTSATF